MCATFRAINHLRDARDAIELALRVPGEMPAMSRQDLEAILDDIAVAGRLIRKAAECNE